MNDILPGESAPPTVPPPPPEYFAMPPMTRSDPAAVAVAPQREPVTSDQPAAMATGESAGTSGCAWAGFGFAVVAVLLLLAAAVFGIWMMRDRIAALLATTIAPSVAVTTVDSGVVAPNPAKPGTAAGQIPAAPLPPQSGKIPPAVNAPSVAGLHLVRVSLRWNKPVDLDLELWDESGRRFIERAFKLGGRDITDGSQPESFVFQDYGELNFSRGKFVVSVCFANEQEPRDNRAEFTLTVTLPDGNTVVRTGTVDWQPGRNQWHAFRIDAVTGEITDLRRVVDIRNPGRDV